MRPFITRVVCAALALAACQSSVRAPVTGEVAAPDWARNAVIYEINVRQYTPEGTFAALEGHLPRLRDLGVDILWLMPVQPIGRQNRKGGLGSYYSIADYTAINPEHGTEADFKRFVEAAHAQGMKVILDWVANHTAFDHPWATQNREWYTLRADGSISVARDNEGRETDWTDVADLNYDNRAMRDAMIDEMRWWLEEMNIDGFRMDVAWGVPMDFWTDVRRELEEVEPDLFLLAEAEGAYLHPVFDMSYAWEGHHIMNEVAQGKKSARALEEYFAKQEREYPLSAMRMYFTSNHDENSWQGTEFERMGANHLPMFVLAATARASMPLLYTGQEVSNAKRLRFFDKDTVNWSGASLAAFYERMFELKDSTEAIWNGAWGGPQVALRTDGGDRVMAYTRTKGESTILVALNFGDAPVQAAYQGLPQPGTYRDWFSGATQSLDASGRLEIPAHGYRVLVRSNR